MGQEFTTTLRAPSTFHTRAPIVAHAEFLEMPGLDAFDSSLGGQVWSRLALPKPCCLINGLLARLRRRSAGPGW